MVLPSNLAGPGAVGVDAIATARSCGHTELQVRQSGTLRKQFIKPPVQFILSLTVGLSRSPP